MDLGLMKKKRSLLSLLSSNDNNENNNCDPNYKKSKKEEHESKYYGDGMVWSRGGLIGKGCFGSVFLANLKKPKSRYTSYPPIMAVKSAEVSVSGSIQKEKEVLNNIVGCRNVIRCFGEEITNGENGQMVYNLLLEYGPGGTLADLIFRQSGSGLPELDVKRRCKEILCGLRHIHNCGYVHCDLKPENILLVGNSVDNLLFAKICDLGLAKRAKQSKKSNKMVQFWRGTPMYFSPEVVIDGVQEAPSDIWAFGCIVLEMLTGKPPWDSKLDTNGDEVLARIGGSNNEVPDIPSTVSREAKSFLKGCFSRKPMYRWTAEMLLAHPFLEGIGDDEVYDKRVEDLGDVFDINAITSSILLDDDETSFSLFSDDLSYLSENEIHFWIEEDVDAIENDISSCLFIEKRSSAAALNEVHRYPVSFTITSGV